MSGEAPAPAEAPRAPASEPPGEPLPPASWGSALKAVLVGGTLCAVPWAGPAWFCRLWVLGWMLEVVARVARQGSSARYPSWRHPWRHARRGLSFFFEAFVLLLPGSFLMHAGWVLAWIISFEKVHDYAGFAFLMVASGILLLMPCFVLLPMATVQAALAPGQRASWDLAAARRVTFARPLLFGPMILLAFFLWLPLQVGRQPRLQNAGQFLLLGWLSFAVVFGVKLLWARYWHAARAALDEGRQAGPWLARVCAVPIVTLSFFYGFATMLVQFLMWSSGWEWFGHFLFLMPGCPAPVARPGLLW